MLLNRQWNLIINWRAKIEEAGIDKYEYWIHREKLNRKTRGRKEKFQYRRTEYAVRDVQSVDKSLTNRGFEVLELRESHRLGGLRDGVVVFVEILEYRVDRAPDVHVPHGGHNDAKLEIVPSFASSRRC